MKTSKPGFPDVVETINIPYLTLELTRSYCEGRDVITGEVRSTLPRSPAADAIESLVLALACEGIHVGDPPFVRAIQTAIDAVNNNARDVPKYYCPSCPHCNGDNDGF